MVISSRENSRYKYFKKLLQKKYRNEEETFFIEGPIVLEEALQVAAPKWVAVSEKKAKDFQKILQKIDKNKVFIFSDQLFQQLADAEHPQGILGYFSFLHKKKLPHKGRFIYCDDIREPGNLGGMIRSADAFGIDGMILSPNTVDLYNPKTIRSTMASIFRLPIYFLNREELFSTQIPLTATTIEGGTSIYQHRFLSDEIIVIGNEAQGICQEILNRASNKVYIPISKGVNSLNANVAASIIMYEMQR